jgi:hypothetical protein
VCTIVHCQCQVSRHPAVSSGVLAHGQPPTTRTQFARRGFCVTSSACSAPRRELLAGAVRTVSSRNSSATSPSSSTRNFAANHSNDWRWWRICQSPTRQASRLSYARSDAPARPPTQLHRTWTQRAGSTALGARPQQLCVRVDTTRPRREKSLRASLLCPSVDDLPHTCTHPRV